MVFKKKKNMLRESVYLKPTQMFTLVPTLKYFLNEVCLKDMKEYLVVLSCFRNCYFYSYLPYTCVQVREGIPYIYFSIFRLNFIKLGV